MSVPALEGLGLAFAWAQAMDATARSYGRLIAELDVARMEPQGPAVAELLRRILDTSRDTEDLSARLDHALFGALVAKPEPMQISSVLEALGAILATQERTRARLRATLGKR